MKRPLVLLPILLLALACGEDGSDVIGPPAPTFQLLTTRSAVLHNLQLAYNERNIARTEELLDDGFMFFLSAGDVHAGLPQQWDRGVEVDATRNLFSKTRVGDVPLVKRIDMDLQFEEGVDWTDFPPPAAPGEIWSTVTAYYNFQIIVDQEGTNEDLTYYPDLNSRAQFTVRNAGTDEEPLWQLVEWRDIGSGLFSTGLSAVPKHTSWGGVKALYRAQP